MMRLISRLFIFVIFFSGSVLAGTIQSVAPITTWSQGSHSPSWCSTLVVYGTSGWSWFDTSTIHQDCALYAGGYPYATNDATISCPVVPASDPMGPYTYNATTSMCERVNPCPITANDGYHFVVGPLVGTQPPAGMAFCDLSTSCQVSQRDVASAFGVGVIQSTSLPVKCQSADSPAPSISAKITPAEAAQVQDVAAKIPFVDPVVTAAARDRAAASEASATAAISKLDAAVAAHQSAVSAQTAAKELVRSAGDKVIASPTAANITNYNNAMTTYNNASTVTTSTMNAVNSNYQIAQTATNSAIDAASQLANVSKGAADLAAALAASTAAFDVSQVAAKTAGTAGLDALKTTMQAAVDALATKFANAQTTSNTTTNTVNNNNTVVNNYNTTVNSVSAANPGLPPVTPPSAQPPAVSAASSIAPAPPPPVGTVAEFCAANPDNAGCATLGESQIPTETIGAKTVDISASMNHFMFSGAAFCPADKIFMTHGQRIVISYAPFCTFLGIFRFMALAVAAFVSGMIILGQRSSDSGG